MIYKADSVVSLIFCRTRFGHEEFSSLSTRIDWINLWTLRVFLEAAFIKLHYACFFLWNILLVFNFKNTIQRQACTSTWYLLRIAYNISYIITISFLGHFTIMPVINCLARWNLCIFNFPTNYRVTSIFVSVDLNFYLTFTLRWSQYGFINFFASIIRRDIIDFDFWTLRWKVFVSELFNLIYL